MKKIRLSQPLLPNKGGGANCPNPRSPFRKTATGQIVFFLCSSLNFFSLLPQLFLIYHTLKAIFKKSSLPGPGVIWSAGTNIFSLPEMSPPPWKKSCIRICSFLFPIPFSSPIQHPLSPYYFSIQIEASGCPPPLNAHCVILWILCSNMNI